MIRLGVNIDHIATLRNARNVGYPDILQAANIAKSSGADVITMHLREDRRHIRDEDVVLIRQQLPLELNLEMAATGEMLQFALQVRPDYVCLVPENRHELTTEGGLDVITKFNILEPLINKLNKNNIKVSVFIDSDAKQILAAKDLGAYAIELHTGSYANITSNYKDSKELANLAAAALLAHKHGLVVNAGHGLNYHNALPILSLPHLHELNIGFAIVARALFVGLEQAIVEMKALIQQQDKS